MADKFLELMVTPSVARAQEHYFGGAMDVHGELPRDALTEDEAQFIAVRGKPGFLHVVSPSMLAFADYKGNRQLLSAGNIAANDRVCLFLMDYPQRTRLKILGHARIEDAQQHPELVAQFAPADVQRIVERVFLIDVVSFDWNCPKHITPRYTAAEVEEAVKPLRERIAELEAKLKTNH